jgi:hypothetical protein
MEAEESPLLEATTKKLPVKTEQTEKTVCAMVICRVCRLGKVL